MAGTREDDSWCRDALTALRNTPAVGDRVTVVDAGWDLWYDAPLLVVSEPGRDDRLHVPVPDGSGPEYAASVQVETDYTGSDDGGLDWAAPGSWKRWGGEDHPLHLALLNADDRRQYREAVAADRSDYEAWLEAAETRGQARAGENTGAGDVPGAGIPPLPYEPDDRMLAAFERYTGD